MDELSSSNSQSKLGRFAPAATIAALLMLAVLLACGGSSSSSTSTTTLQTITITPSTVSIGINQSTNFIATATDSSGNAVSNLAYTWNSSDPTVAVVTNGGLATGLKAGTVQITASVTTVAATATTPATVVTSNTATLSVIPPVAKVTAAPVSAQIAVGGTQQYTATVADANGNAIKNVVVTWGLTNAAVASIDANGLARGISPGTVTVFAQANGVTSPGVQLTVTQ